MKNAPFSIWLPDEYRESLAIISHLTQYSQSQIAAKAIAEYVSRNEWKPKNIDPKGSTH
jgi:predicted transcriptional regulator